jgi:hypothetical protein
VVEERVIAVELRAGDDDGGRLAAFSETRGRSMTSCPFRIVMFAVDVTRSSRAAWFWRSAVRSESRSERRTVGIVAVIFGAPWSGFLWTTPTLDPSGTVV